ncbi:3-deoxy-manno-octulosonate cytidylyltransferase [Notoacmeibacter sp. MSK16QG-6]|uniref:3-deoxy-manno-octulosonate cytidylyltransferase n=1 Tax=Notoacmeibacter sp. MSK16QG-6 TaxID=2957982 RepID=UPI00209DE1B5|nr:3-deoxy-manno-octulosonate cytidylyltransferase [Notoacmeibacter sp. MSK16QG-6]MCP1198746.1 3-deoxy-manno-octulosonate cytidylyltransferase [Notoacmeibacter sp. MSK16QG-6]
MTSMALIPARLAASRLPGKPLADICGRPMIVHVAERTAAAGLGRVAVATDDEEIRAAVESAGFEAVMTSTEHPSGSDRIFEALQKLDPTGEVEIVVNVQGDLPTLDPAIVKSALALLDDPDVAIGTLGAPITNEAEMNNPNVVKIVGSPLSDSRLRALYFTRATAPWGEGTRYHHIGLYAYRRDALARFVALPRSALEKRERLEQLRALEAAMRIDAAIVDDVPLGVDTPADLDEARRRIARSGRG